MTRVAINPELLLWARERASLGLKDLETKFPKLGSWEVGEVQPTLKQVEAFARAVHVPVGYLFLSKPPEESLPIPDFRTVAGQTVPSPSPNLLEMLYVCQERQAWYREFARITGQSPPAFVGSATRDMRPGTVAARMREILSFQVANRKESSTWEDALRKFIRHADAAGVLVMVSGVVMSNNHRRLDPVEFRGFALSDPVAPLVFVNGTDSKAAQMFTLAHELAHLWLGSSALSDIGAKPAQGSRQEETWCNAVAAEFLVPLDALQGELRHDEPLPETLARCTRTFKVSRLVVLRRLLDAGWIEHETFEAQWSAESTRIQGFVQGNSGGGDFYKTTLTRVSRRFAEALVVSTLEGQTLYRDALRMLGISKVETFHALGREAGIPC